MSRITNKEMTIVDQRSATRSGSIVAALRGDFLPSIAVFLVALPLCMGIAIASGVPVAAGLITGIVGGILVGTLAGAPLQVSGPAAGLTVIVYGIVQQFGLEALGAVVLMAGAIQIVAGLLRLGQWFRAVSPAVIHGMLAGIGILILASQFHVMVDDAPKQSGLQNLLTLPQAIGKGLPWPARRSPQERQERSELMKRIGVLHQRQLALLGESKAVARQMEANGSEFSTERRAPLVGEQQKIVDEIRGVVQSLNSDPGAKGIEPAAKELARNTAETAEQALSALRSEEARQWTRAQQTSADSLRSLALSLRSHDWAAKIGLLTIVVLLAWQTFRPRRLRSIPAPLMAVLAATLVTAYWHLPIVCVEVPDSLFSTIRIPDLSLLGSLPIAGLVQAAFVIAVVASAETLLCATAVDQMHSGPRTNYDRELMAQGLGNCVCGLLGALPMTGVIVRSAANVQAGGKTRMSAFLHGCWLLLFVALLGSLLRYIPIASLAAVLVYTGYKLVNIEGIKKLRKYGWGEVFIYAATVIGVVVEDLLIGVAIGIALSSIKLLVTFAHLRVSITDEPRTDRSVLSLDGAATFLRLPLLAAKLEQVRPDAELHVDLERLEYIDHACLDLIMNWAKQHEATGGRLVIDWNSLHASFRRQAVAHHRSVA